MNLQEKLNEVQNELASEKAKNGVDRNPQLIATLEQKEAEVLRLMDKEKRMNEIETELAALDPGLASNEQRIISLRAELDELKKEFEPIQEKTERDQAHAERVAGLLDRLQETAMYEKIYGEKPEGERIHEYEENRKQFYLIIGAIVEQEKQDDRNFYENLLDQKDEKISILTRQGMETEDQLAEARRLRDTFEAESNQYAADYAQLEEDFEKVKQERDDAVQENAKLNQDIQQLKGQITELESKLESIQKPRTTVDIKESISNLKPAYNVDDMMAKFYARNPELATDIPSVNPVTPFRDEDTADNQTDPENNRVHTSEVDAIDNTFPKSDEQKVAIGLEYETGSVPKEVTWETVEKLAERVTNIEMYLRGETKELAS